jgi:hypothetical protein
MLRPFAAVSVLVSVLAASGCAGGPKSSSSSSTDGTNIPNTPTELAAYAGNARFPATQPTFDQTLAAIVSRDKKQLTIYNFGRQAIRNVDVWVNGSYVKRIGGIAPQSKVAINTSEIFNGLGHTLASRGEELARVQLDEGGRLVTVQGPLAE